MNLTSVLINKKKFEYYHAVFENNLFFTTNSNFWTRSHLYRILSPSVPPYDCMFRQMN